MAIFNPICTHYGWLHRQSQSPPSYYSAYPKASPEPCKTGCQYVQSARTLALPPLRSRLAHACIQHDDKLRALRLSNKSKSFIGSHTGNEDHSTSVHHVKL